MHSWKLNPTKIVSNSARPGASAETVNISDSKQTLRPGFCSYHEIGSELCMLFGFLRFVNAAKM